MNGHYYLDRILSERNVTVYHWSVWPAQSRLLSSTSNCNKLSFFFYFISFCCWLWLQQLWPSHKSSHSPNTRMLLVWWRFSIALPTLASSWINGKRKWRTQTDNEKKNKNVSNSIFFLRFDDKEQTRELCGIDFIFGVLCIFHYFRNGRRLYELYRNQTTWLATCHALVQLLLQQQRWSWASRIHAMHRTNR